MINPLDDNIYIRSPIYSFGKLRNTQSLRILFNSSCNTKGYSFDQTFALSGDSIGDGMVLDMWAGERVDRLLRTQGTSLMAMKEALAMSLGSRILSPVTALLALEKGMADTSAYRDDASGNNGGLTGVKGNAAAVTAGHMAIKAVQRGTMVCISVTGIEQPGSGNGMTLKVFDLTGKLVMYLTNSVKAGVKTIEIGTGRFAPGTCLVKLCGKKKTVSAVFTVVSR